MRSAKKETVSVSSATGDAPSSASPMMSVPNASRMCESATRRVGVRSRRLQTVRGSDGGNGSQPPSTPTVDADTPSSSVGTRPTPIWSPLLPNHRSFEDGGAAPRFRQLRNREEEDGAQSRAATGIQSRRASYHPLLHAQDHMVVQREAWSRQPHTASRCG